MNQRIRKRNNINPAYKSFREEIFPISFGILPVNSFHMKSLTENKMKTVLKYWQENNRSDLNLSKINAISIMTHNILS